MKILGRVYNPSNAIPMKAFHVFFLLTLFFLYGCKEGDKIKDGPLIGVKIYDTQNNYDNLFKEWNDIGINTAYVSVALAYDIAFRKLAQEKNVDIFIILPIFFNPEALKEHPEWYAIDQDGMQAIDEWVMFANPANKDYRAQRIAYINKVVSDTKPNGISIDFIRYFAYWEKIHSGRTLESIPDTSFDSLSLAHFQNERTIEIPDTLQTVTEKSDWILKKHRESWTEWKVTNITSMVHEIVSSAKSVQPDLLTNLHLVPWREDDFGGANKKIVGQDAMQLSKYVDFISPMCYSHMLKRNSKWVASIVHDLHGKAGETAILPSIQVKEAYLKNILSEKEFEENLKAALAPPSKGVIFWSWAHLEQDSSKKNIIKKIIKGL
jgi:uncharacterized lipoprotein YddW (UPF0748 family)